jgi:outer membrane protein
MKSFVTAIATALLAALALPAGSAWADGPQIGFVDMERVFAESRPGRLSKEALDVEAAGYSRELNGFVERARVLQDELTRNGLTLSGAERDRREREIRDLNAQFERKKSEYTEEWTHHRQEAFDALAKHVQGTVVKIAEAEKLEVVVSRAVAVNSSVDITAKIIRALDDAADSK